MMCGAALSAVYILIAPFLIRAKKPKKGKMSEHHDIPKAHEAHAIQEVHAKGPHDPREINPKMSSDIAYWSKEFGITGEKLHEAIRAHGTHVDKIRAALHKAG